MKALDAQIAGLQAELAKAKTDLERAQELFARGTTSKVASMRRRRRLTSHPTP